MSINILDLPEEILLQCIKAVANSERAEAFAEAGDAHTGDIEEIAFTASPFLCRARLVCRVFWRIAAPWFWRELDVSLPFTNRVICATGKQPVKPTSNLKNGAFQRVKYLLEHPEYIKYLQVLSIRYYKLPRRCDASFATLSRFLDAPNNLRFLMVGGGGGGGSIGCGHHDRDGYEHLAWDFKLKNTIKRNTKLHTVISDGCPMLLYFPYAAYTMKNIRNVRVCLSREVLEFLHLCVDLRSLAISRTVLTEREVEGLRMAEPWMLSWDSIEELQLEGLTSAEVEAIAANYSIWKADFPKCRPPLVELAIHSIMPSTCAENVLLCFKGSDVRFLALTGIKRIGLSLVKHVTDGFKALETLCLMSLEESVSWKLDPGDALDELKKLTRLQCLSWNYSAIAMPRLEDYDIVEEVMSEQYALLLPLLARTCPQLRNVNTMFEDNSFSYIIQREARKAKDTGKERKGKETTEEVKWWRDFDVRISWTPHTSSWKPGNFLLF